MDFDLFLAHSLSFREPKDIPRLVVMRQASERIMKEVWENNKREDVRGLKLDHAIRVYQVGIN